MKRTMKKTLAIVLAIFMIVSTVPVVFAATEVAEGTAGEGITWVLDSDGTLTISGTGEMDTSWYSPPWQEYNDLIKNIVVEEGITEVSNTAFAYAENLVTVSLPSTLTYISGWAFYKNFALEEINVAETNTAYKDIDDVLFTEDEKTLVMYPMNKACEEYAIPASVTTIGEMAFTQCGAVDKVIVPDTVTTLDDSAFAYSRIKAVEIGNGVTEIPIDCFMYSSVEKVIISDSVETISQQAFVAASHLHTLIIGSGVKTINIKSFHNTSSLKIIHYKGTQETWDVISINEDNEDLNGKTLHFISADSYKAEAAPTCADGHTAGYYCDECDAYLTGEVIPAVDEHIPGTEVEENIVAPDCTTAGSKDVVIYCTACGEETSRETVETAGALGHDWNNSVCDTCGETCAHDDNDYDEICDKCEAEVPIIEAKLDETNTVYIPEEHVDVVVKFTPTETGEYVIYSDNGGDDENIDPYVDIYDSNGDEVEDDDDHNGSYNFYCIFEAEAGETYYIELSCYDGDVEYDYTIEKHVDISHQPTASEPYVELTWDVDADYQWYSVEVGDAEATDENVEAYSYDGETATYDSENGWTPIIDADNYYSSATLELEEGDTVVVEFAESGFGRFGFYDWEQGNESGNGSEIDGILTYECTIDEDGVYTFFTNYPLAHKIYANIEDYVVIEGETEATLQNPEIGTKYACKVTLENGDVLTSDGFENVYAITHQPTTEEPYVELNDDTDATYQWYSVEEKTVEITDENADAINYNNGSEYDAELGWSGDFWSSSGAYFFSIYLNEGDVISVDFGEAVNDEIGIWEDSIDDGVYEENGTADGKIEFVAPWDGYFDLYAYGVDSETRVKAYMGGYEYTAINGETDALYVPTEEGLYACEVTFADDTTEMSDVFEGPHIHSYEDGVCGCGDEIIIECEHNCHKGGIVGFFWKIANFFNRIFGTKQYCDCGIAHY